MIAVFDADSPDFELLKSSLKEKNRMIKISLKGFLIITSMILFSSSINAECTKDDILKLINAGYSKMEISGLCENKDGSISSSKPTPGDTWTDPVIGMEFIFVPGGCFKMGSNSGDNDEKPVHEVCIDGFWMGKYEVTQGQWRKITGNRTSYYRLGDNFPVESVSWFMVQHFILLLNEQTGRVFSLPSETQWEYAARSGGKNEKMVGKNDIDHIAWHRGNSSAPHRIGSKAPNGLNLFDMVGNVSEWCKDIYHKNAYSMHSRNNPLVTSSGSSYVKRGGSFGNNLSLLRPENRGELSPTFSRSDLGFRLCFSNVQK